MEKKIEEGGQPPIIKAYAIRWYILTVFIIYNTLSSLQWIQYSIIANLVLEYYNVSVVAVDWSSMIFMIMWPTLVFPASFIIDRMGLRVAALIGAGFTAVGAMIKVFSIGPDLFYVVLIGQTLVAISQIFILNLPSKIAITWFLPEEASRVCAFGIFGMSLGTALGFMVPPIVIRDHDNAEDIGSDLRMMCWALAILCVPVAMLVFFYFPKEPAYPPSLAQHHARKNQGTVSLSIFLSSLSLLMKNRPFRIHMLSFGCNLGIYASFGTLLNQLVLEYFEGAQEDAGRMGTVMILVGIVGQILIGMILDKTRKFKETAIVVFIFCTISMGGFLFALEMKLTWLCYVTISIFGLFLSAYIPVGYEVGIELTYPSPESTVNGLLLASSQVISVPLTMALSEINARYGAFYVLVAQCSILGIGTVCTCITPNKLYRQEAFKSGIATEDIKA